MVIIIILLVTLLQLSPSIVILYPAPTVWQGLYHKCYAYYFINFFSAKPVIAPNFSFLPIGTINDMFLLLFKGSFSILPRA